MPEARPIASQSSLAPGSRFAIRPFIASAELAANSLRELRETDPLYRAQGLLHPVIPLRAGTAALTQNVRLGPWVHCAAEIRHTAPARIGARIGVAAVVAANHVHNGHAMVELDAAILADGIRVAEIRHSAIWRLRERTAAQPRAATCP